MQQMTAIAITRPGGPEVLQPVKIAVPVPGPGQVLVHVKAAGDQSAGRPPAQGGLSAAAGSSGHAGP